MCDYFSAGIVYRRQNLTSIDGRFWRLKTAPALKRLKKVARFDKSMQSVLPSQLISFSWNDNWQIGSGHCLLDKKMCANSKYFMTVLTPGILLRAVSSCLATKWNAPCCPSETRIPLKLSHESRVNNAFRCNDTIWTDVIRLKCVIFCERVSTLA